MDFVFDFPVMALRSTGGPLLSPQGVIRVVADYLWVFLVAMAACAIPIWRAVRSDPTEALRA